MAEIPITAKEVVEPLYSFIQNSFKNDHNRFKSIRLNRSCESTVFQRLSSNVPLTQQDVADLSIAERRLLYELLTQYVMFLSMFHNLTFPEEFLDGSSSSQLGASILSYIVENSWPFPQMLPH